MHTGTTNAGKPRTPPRSAGSAAPGGKAPFFRPRKCGRAGCAQRAEIRRRADANGCARQSARKRRFGRSMATGGGQRP